jgi:hypothetical protein
MRQPSCQAGPASTTRPGAKGSPRQSELPVTMSGVRLDSIWIRLTSLIVWSNWKPLSKALIYLVYISYWVLITGNLAKFLLILSIPTFAIIMSKSNSMSSPKRDLQAKRVDLEVSQNSFPEFKFIDKTNLYERDDALNIDTRLE